MILSNYTTPLRYIVESKNIDIGLHDYPIFEESYRESLNNKIIEHYYFNEIGFETPERFIFELNKKMKEIMPLYNKIYLAELLERSPFTSFKRDIVKNDIESVSGSNQNVVNATANSKILAEKDATTDRDTTQIDKSKVIDKEIDKDNKMSIESNTPTDLLSVADIKSNVYASKAVVNDGESTKDRDTQTTDNSTAKVEEVQKDKSKQDSNTSQNQQATTSFKNDKVVSNKDTVTGFNQSMSSLIKEYRSSLVNIDMMVIDELKSKFMGILGDYKEGKCLNECGI